MIRQRAQWETLRTARRNVLNALTRDERPTHAQLNAHAQAVLYGLDDGHLPADNARRRELADEVEREVAAIVADSWLDETPDGWRSIIDPVVDQIDALGGRMRKAKEKWGALCLYYDLTDDVSDDAAAKVGALIEEAEARCSRTCELCGSADGRVRLRGASPKIARGVGVMCPRCFRECLYDRVHELLVVIEEASVARDGWVPRDQIEECLPDGWSQEERAAIDDALEQLAGEELVARREVDGRMFFSVVEGARA